MSLLRFPCPCHVPMEHFLQDFAHWFFPLRGGGGAVGGMLGAFKKDTLIDLEFGSKSLGPIYGGPIWEGPV